jgi:iron complex transport system ATP-binding protein
MALLEIRGVRAGYGARDVLDGVSLDVAAGEVVALLGPNGAGKTTLLRVAGGVLAPLAGTVRVDGRDLASLSARDAARLVSGVPQDDVADFAFTLRQVVALGRAARLGALGRERPEDRAAVEGALEAVDLGSLAARAVTEVSAGERRRASVARCLAQDASVLLLDEPAAHLDLGHAARVLARVASLARERGKAVLASVHDPNLASAVADRVALLVGGRVAALGPPAEVLVPFRLEAAFGAAVRVLGHPDGGGPVVVAARGEGGAR